MIVLPARLSQPNQFVGVDVSQHRYKDAQEIVKVGEPFFKELAFFNSAIDESYGTDWDESGLDRRCHLNALQMIELREEFQQEIIPRYKNPFSAEPIIIALLADKRGMGNRHARMILDGEIAPYIGGRLRLHRNRGINPKAWVRLANKMICYALIRSAYELLDDRQFQVFCWFNSMTTPEAIENLSKAEGSYDNRKRQLDFQCSLHEEALGRRRTLGVAGTRGLTGR